MRRDGEPEPRTLTLEEAHAGVRPRQFTRAEWDAMNLCVYSARMIAADIRRQDMHRIVERLYP